MFKITKEEVIEKLLGMKEQYIFEIIGEKAEKARTQTILFKIK